MSFGGHFETFLAVARDAMAARAAVSARMSRVAAGLALVGLPAAAFGRPWWVPAAVAALAVCGAAWARVAVGKFVAVNAAACAVWAAPTALASALRFPGVAPSSALASASASPGAWWMPAVDPAALAGGGVLALRAFACGCVATLTLRVIGLTRMLAMARSAGLPAGVAAAFGLTLSHATRLAGTALAMAAARRARVIHPPTLAETYRATGIHGAVLLRKGLAGSRDMQAALEARGYAGRWPDGVSGAGF